jgi:hypothetical protein
MIMGHADDLKSYEAAINDARARWPKGPWTGEPDRVEWAFDGFPCLMVRSIVTGAWCGYVGVPPSHPFHGKHYAELELDFPIEVNYARGCNGPICHVPEPGVTDAVHWIGFDCAHAFDDTPALASALVGSGLPTYGRYRALDEVRHLVHALALELKSVQLEAGKP